MLKISMKKIKKYYGTRLLLDIEDLKVYENDKIGIVGVNGVGKTTSVGKLASSFKSQGKKVLLAAADTFRAAAIEQLTEWAKRLRCWFFLFFLLETVQEGNHEEDDKSHDEKINDRRNEFPVGNDRDLGSRCFCKGINFFAGKIDKEV